MAEHKISDEVMANTELLAKLPSPMKKEKNPARKWKKSWVM